jgi:diguanylate cyclase (GGDEF)-like protein
MLSETDELTGILNRRGFAIIADRLFGQAVRYNRPISILAIDCDNLKQVNDGLGHKAGDTLLVSLVKSIQGQLRHTDVLARVGGDEFVLLLPETGDTGALDAAEKIRAAVAASSLAMGGKIVRTTVSIGVASYPNSGTTLDLLQAHADHNMYQAKFAGRNCVIQQTDRPAGETANS